VGSSAHEARTVPTNIVTIMLNYVMEFLILFLLGLGGLPRAGPAESVSPPVDNNAMLPHLAGATLRINAGFLVALAAALPWGGY